MYDTSTATNKGQNKDHNRHKRAKRGRTQTTTSSTGVCTGGAGSIPHNKRTDDASQVVVCASQLPPSIINTGILF